jgi:hypothetical protein
LAYWQSPIKANRLTTRTSEKLSKLGMACFGCTPDHLPDLLAAVLKGQALRQFAQIAQLA